MDDTARKQVEDSTGKALQASLFEDFRGGYRDRLRWLKEARPDAFGPALTHYNDVLIPNVAAGADPIREWIEYGRRLGELAGRGKVVRIDGTGRARPFDGELDGLILHVPEDTAVPVLGLAVPRELSDAQRATLDLLVKAPR